MNALEFLNNIGNTNFADIQTLNNPIPIIERYAIYKTKELQTQILEYRRRLKKLKDGEEIERMFVAPGEFIMSEILEDFDKHFNITIEKNGK